MQTLSGSDSKSRVLLLETARRVTLPLLARAAGNGFLALGMPESCNTAMVLLRLDTRHCEDMHGCDLTEMVQLPVDPDSSKGLKWAVEDAFESTGSARCLDQDVVGGKACEQVPAAQHLSFRNRNSQRLASPRPCL